MTSVWIVVRAPGGSRWLAGVFAEDAELDARRLASAPGHTIMRVHVAQKDEPLAAGTPREQKEQR